MREREKERERERERESKAITGFAYSKSLKDVGLESAVHIGYNPMVRTVWLNTSPRRLPRAVRPEGGVEGWCPAIPRGPLGCILLTTIVRGKECFCGR